MKRIVGILCLISALFALEGCGPSAFTSSGSPLSVTDNCGKRFDTTTEFIEWIKTCDTKQEELVPDNLEKFYKFVEEIREEGYVIVPFWDGERIEKMDEEFGMSFGIVNSGKNKEYRYQFQAGQKTIDVRFDCLNDEYKKIINEQGFDAYRSARYPNAINPYNYKEERFGDQSLIKEFRAGEVKINHQAEQCWIYVSDNIIQFMFRFDSKDASIIFKSDEYDETMLEKLTLEKVYLKD